MKFIFRAALYTVLIYASYQLLSAYLRPEQSDLPKILQQYADDSMQRYLCQTPVGWRIGQLDPAFNLTQQQAEEAAQRAAQQWNNAIGMPLFEYDSINGFPINFAYDERQQQALKHALLQRNISRYDENIAQRSDSLNRDIEQLKQKQQQFDVLSRQFAAELARYEERAENATTADHEWLRTEQQRLIDWQKQLEHQADELNAEQRQILRQQKYINETVADRNAMLPTEPLTTAEVGLMEIRNKERIMTIFAFKTEDDLVLTMTHEFGHALGLGHTDGSTSVMHQAINGSQSGLTDEDINALRQQCGF